MSRWWVLLGLVLVLDQLIETSSLVPRKARKPKRVKKMKAGEMTEMLVSLKKNVTSMRTKMEEMGSSRVMVHVHGGLESDPSDTHECDDGTHVHIHMHMDHGGSHHHDDEMDHMHHGHGDEMDHMDHGHGDEMDHTEHGHPDHMGDMEHGHHRGMHNHMGHGDMMKSKKKKMMKLMHDHMHFPDDASEYLYGHCEMNMNSKLSKSPHDIKGAIHLRQRVHGPLEMIIHLKGFHVPKGNHAGHDMHTHGFHVHQFGDISDGCQSFGGHFNPDGVDHAAKDAAVRHAGDWGNIACDDEGEVHVNTNDTNVSLVGNKSIMGRGIVIHESPDDLGQGGVAASKKTGNAGARLACCIVAWAAEHEWEMLEKHQH